MAWTNYHNHCYYCDGALTIEDHIKTAIELSVFSFAMSCHAPVPFYSKWNMKREDLADYMGEIATLRKKYEQQLDVYASLEVDFIPDMIGPTHPMIRSLDLDFTIGSVHYMGNASESQLWEIDGNHEVFRECLDTYYHGDVELLVRDYFGLIRDMAGTSRPDVIGHLDKIKMQNIDQKLWDEEADWYKEAVLNTLEVIRMSQSIVEINTRGLYKGISAEPYPGNWILERIKELKIPVCLNSDAHQPKEITSHFTDISAMVKSMGFKHLWYFNSGQWEPVPFSERGLQR